MLVFGISTPSISQVTWWPPRTCSWSCTTYAPGTKSVIIARLLVRSAPGVGSMSRRSTSVVGVNESAVADAAVALTVTVSSGAPGCSCMCVEGAAPDTTVSGSASVAKPFSSDAQQVIAQRHRGEGELAAGITRPAL